ncbi:MAG: TIGR00295 family protein [Candidatus Hadarchaeales archaeon]
MKREDAILLLKKVGCSIEVIHHSLAVEKIAVEVAEKIKNNGKQVDVEKVRIGALLHDIGRAKTHDIFHGVVGEKILRDLDLDEFARFASCHIGAGIPRPEAKKLGLPPKDFLPETLEEKIVAYSDKLAAGDRRISPEEAIEDFRSKLGPGHPAIKRFEELQSEILKLMGG